MTLAYCVQVSSGSSHSLALSRSGAIFAFGNGELGQLAHGTHESSTLPIAVPAVSHDLALFVAAAGDHSFAVCQSRLTAGSASAGLTWCPFHLVLEEYPNVCVFVISDSTCLMCETNNIMCLQSESYILKMLTFWLLQALIVITVLVC